MASMHLVFSFVNQLMNMCIAVNAVFTQNGVQNPRSDTFCDVSVLQ